MSGPERAYRTPHIDPITASKLQGIASQLATNWNGGPISRSEFFAGFQDPRRNFNKECGYPEGPLLNPDRYRNLYDEDPIACRVVQLMPFECFKTQPAIYESQDANTVTPFEEAWDELSTALRGEQSWFQDEKGNPIIEHWKRADMLSGIGYFGVMLLGIDDGKNLDQPVDGVATLIPTANESLAVNVRKDGSRVIRVRKRERVLSDAQRLIQGFVRTAPSSPSKELDRARPTYTVNQEGKTERNEGRQFSIESGDEPVGGWAAYNAAKAPSKKGNPNGSPSGFKKSPGTPGYSTSTPNTPPLNDSNDPSRDTQDDNDDQNDITGQTDAAQPDKSDPANKGSIAPTSFAGAQGTDAQYVGVELSPPEYPATDRAGEKRNLLFIRSFDESLVQIVQYEADLRNPRFGQPVMYRITLNDPRDQHSGVGLPIATVRVHWSRLIHLADNRNSSEIFGVPRMRPVLHPILDDMKIRGAGAEGYWQSCFTRYSWETHPQLGGDVIIDEQKLQATFYNLRNTLQRDAVTSGMTAKSLAPAVVDPKTHHDIQIETICILLGCPVRVFKGSERGELASSQDDSAWNDRVAERQNDYVTPRLIVPFIDRLIAMGVLPEPEGYSVEWPDLDSTTKKDKAMILFQRTQAYAAYVAGSVEAVIPIEVYMTQFDNMTDEQAMSVMDKAQKAQEEGLQTMPQPGELGHPATAAPPPVPPGMNPGGGSGDAAASESSDQQPSSSEPGADDSPTSTNNPGNSDEDSDPSSERSNRTQTGNRYFSSFVSPYESQRRRTIAKKLTDGDRVRIVTNMERIICAAMGE